MTCTEFVELVTEYLEGALPRAECSRFEAHVAACEGCEVFLAQMRATLDVVGRLREEDVPEAMRDDLLAAFRGFSGSPG